MVVADDVPAADVEAAVRAAGGDLLERLRLFDVYRGEQVGEGSKSLALRLEFRAPDRTLTDEEVPRFAAGSRRSSPSWEGSSVASVAVVGASGFAGALCAALVERHPRLQLDVVTARSDAGRVLSDLYPRYRVDRKLETFDADRVAEACDAALVAYPHGASAPTVEDLRARGLKVVDLGADFRLPASVYERWYGRPHTAPDLLDGFVFGLPELFADPRARAAWPRPVATRPPRCLAPLVADGIVERRPRRRCHVGRVGARGAGPRQATHYGRTHENVAAYTVHASPPGEMEWR